MSVLSENRCSALRRLNPFRGVTQMLVAEAGRAVSFNGSTWEVHVLVDAPAPGWGSLNRKHTSRRYLRLGFWHLDEGLKRAPLNPSLDRDAVCAAAEQVDEQLRLHATKVPFALEDRFELWLLGEDGQPLALLASTDTRANVKPVRRVAWHASKGFEVGFRSRSLLRRGIPDDFDGSVGHHPRLLESLVLGAARQQNARSRWFERRADGSGVPLDTETATLAADRFPPLGLRERWLETRNTELVADYLDWLAPRLLTLQGLSTTTRIRLERAARRQALLVDTMHRLYPCVVDTEVIKAARVEARLRRSNATRPETAR